MQHLPFLIVFHSLHLSTRYPQLPEDRSLILTEKHLTSPTMSTTVSRATWLLAAVFCILIPSTNAFPVNLADAAQPGQVSFTVGSNVYFMNATYDMAPTGRIEFTIGSSSYIIDPDSNTISDTSTGGKRWTLLALFAVLVCFRATIAVLRSSWREDFRKEWLAEQNGNRLLHRELDTVARVWELPKRMVRIEEVAESPPPANGTAHLQVPGPSLSYAKPYTSCSVANILQRGCRQDLLWLQRCRYEDDDPPDGPNDPAIPDGLPRLPGRRREY